MSRSVLATRLRQLERAGLLTRTEPAAGRGARYALTPAGRDLAGVLSALAAWGERWVDIGPEHTDPGFALWAWCLAQLDREQLPPGRLVVAFDFSDQPPGHRHYWLLVDDGDAQVCYTDPGDEPALRVEAESAAFLEWHRGRRSWTSALRSGQIRVAGNRRLAASLPRWNLREPRLMA
jgi:hypothetical protein